ncbi:MAG: 3-hydroxyacyl-CoA dehydrogenase family protein [Anaerolineae bacterium]|nr:3-hydroxyacyl-CoA dehydrogenase family protein [Anaerolineae bacterium]
MKIIIAGENPFVETVYHLCDASGHVVDAYLVENFMQAVQSGYIIENLTDADVVIELHHESPAAKNELLLLLADVVPQNALILTSALATSTTQAASWIPRSERVIGFGVLPPFEEGGLVELALGLNSAESTLTRAQSFWESVGMTPVVVKDSVGLVRARIVCCIINEAATALQEGIATPADIDQAMKLGTNYPHGPLRWADYLGIDTVLGVMRGLYDEWQEDRYRPAPLLHHMVMAGHLGRKTGRGFYEYDS